MGDGERAEEPDSIEAWLKEISDFSSVLNTAIPAHDNLTVSLTVDTVGAELRELTEHFPDHKDPTVTEGSTERRRARQSLKEVVLCLRRIGLAGSANDFDAAMLEFSNCKQLIQSAVPDMKRAQRWSLFDPKIHEMHYAALRRVSESATPAAH